ncbi:MAG TPA: hypothetical protein VIJ25_04310, partial [Methylococcales bacterium]
MKTFKHLIKKTRLIVVGAVFALSAFVAVPAIVHASAGPNRETKAYYDGVPGFDHVTFNSFTGVPGIGDERNFFNGHYSDAGSVYADPMPQVKQDDVLTLEVYVHNNADSSLNDVADHRGIATNTKVRVAIPSTIAKAQQATAYISADNALPQTVYDTMDFSAANGGLFQLEYVPGSAHLHGNFLDTKLSDSIVTTGAPVGTDALDGQLKGCYKQMVLVTLQVKVEMPNYSLVKQVRMKGETKTDWTKLKAPKAGDTVQWSLFFNNVGKTPLDHVIVLDQVPAGLTVVPGTVRLVNTLNPGGYVFPDTAIIDKGRTISLDIGSYNPAAGAYVYYDTTVDKPGATACQAFTLTNKAYL